MKLTKDIVRRIESHKIKLSDPCVICGEDFATCGHTMEETALVIKEVIRMSKKQVNAILLGE